MLTQVDYNALCMMSEGQLEFIRKNMPDIYTNFIEMRNDFKTLKYFDPQNMRKNMEIVEKYPNIMFYAIVKKMPDGYHDPISITPEHDFGRNIGLLDKFADLYFDITVSNRGYEQYSRVFCDKEDRFDSNDDPYHNIFDEYAFKNCAPINHKLIEAYDRAAAIFK